MRECLRPALFDLIASTDGRSAVRVDPVEDDGNAASWSRTAAELVWLYTSGQLHELEGKLDGMPAQTGRELEGVLGSSTPLEAGLGFFSHFGVELAVIGPLEFCALAGINLVELLEFLKRHTIPYEVHTGRVVFECSKVAEALRVIANATHGSSSC